MMKYEEVEVECDVNLRKGFWISGGERNIQSAEPDAIRLEQIKVPKFDGICSTWISFKSLVHDNGRLSGVQKLQYLRASIKGEASRQMRHLNISDTSYSAAWNILAKTYDEHIIAVTFDPVLKYENCSKRRRHQKNDWEDQRAHHEFPRPGNRPLRRIHVHSSEQVWSRMATLKIGIRIPGNAVRHWRSEQMLLF